MYVGKQFLRCCSWSCTICCFALVACSDNQEPELLPSQTLTQVTPQLAPPPLPRAPLPREIQPTKSTTKVIDAGGGSGQPKTLVEASRLAKARKGQAGESVAVINDENLHEYAKDADIILLESAPAAPVATLEPVREPETNRGDEIRDEQYWRNRALELRMGWRRAIDRIADLELESAALRQQFYAEDDPYLRDSQLKPSWDRVLDRLDQLRDQATQYEQELDVLVAEGQRANVPQGWLNQGWELEPTLEERESAEKASSQAVDPPIAATAVEPKDYTP